ncbi:hypothetical protein GCM10027290_34620 [Micromonospora sonneratiae]
MTALPPIPAGTRLYLHPDDWYHPNGNDPTYFRYVIVSVAHTDTATATETSVWIVGHELKCTSPDTENHTPCVEIRVKRDAITRSIRAATK